MTGRAEEWKEAPARSRTAEWRQAPAPENGMGRESSRGMSFGEAQGSSRGEIRSEAASAESFGSASGATVAKTFGRESGTSLSSEPVTVPPQPFGAAREASNAACSGDARDMLDTCLEEVWNISRRHRAGEDWRNIATDISATDRKLHGLVDAMTQTFPGHEAAKEVVRLLKDVQKNLGVMVGRSSYDKARFNNAFDALMQAKKVFRIRVK